MKKRGFLGAIIAVIAVFALVLTGCSKNDSNKTSMKNPIAGKTAKEALTSHNNLWYMNGKINYHSESGIDAYHFNKSKQTVTIYSVSKIYKTFSQAKKAKDLNKQGTLKYTFKNSSANNPVIYMKGKLAGIPMDQTVSVKSKVSGTYKKDHINVAGFRVVRDLDADKTHQVLVTPKY
ncbi:hypothetical protein [Lentilactobacillus sp. Marseille-Q4993]|uniref:hypothetical protein n=1 Tax=Lentilactobacillus sp. Marseille-Q4993 TaxID=3039492 RepID=UPI0024BD483D|nr:hypothetical protein [Lentilactobacillus sp. Marseille-Q4993]